MRQQAFSMTHDDEYPTTTTKEFDYGQLDRIRESHNRLTQAIQEQHDALLENRKMVYRGHN
jgi:hypothetical protein